MASAGNEHNVSHFVFEHVVCRLKQDTDFVVLTRKLLPVLHVLPVKLLSVIAELMAHLQTLVVYL